MEGALGLNLLPLCSLLERVECSAVSSVLPESVMRLGIHGIAWPHSFFALTWLQLP